MKRLGRSTRPSVLDLGRLSGPNIEIFARLGARVQVEDLMAALDEGAAAALRPAPVAGDLPAAGSPATVAAPASDAPSRAAEGGLPGGARSAVPGEPPPGPVSVQRGPGSPATGTLPPGVRPSRRIVLPPRHQARPLPTGDAGVAARPASGPAPSPLPSRFDHDDATFDAVLGWDLFNYYDPATARRVAAEISRILKPGGLVFAWFHSKSVAGPDGPRRFRVIDETRFQVDPFDGRALPRHLFQNRDIEKMFTDVRIAELYFLKNGVREMMLEKSAPGAPRPAGIPPARPRPRFRLE
jgi:SAM-dependent methyltransferase